jgi:hypothetical protein
MSASPPLTLPELTDAVPPPGDRKPPLTLHELTNIALPPGDRKLEETVLANVLAVARSGAEITVVVCARDRARCATPEGDCSAPGCCCCRSPCHAEIAVLMAGEGRKKMSLRFEHLRTHLFPLTPAAAAQWIAAAIAPRPLCFRCRQPRPLAGLWRDERVCFQCASYQASIGMPPAPFPVCRVCRLRPLPSDDVCLTCRVRVACLKTKGPPAAGADGRCPAS